MIQIYTLEQAERWDSIVRSFLAYDIYWFSGYVKAFFAHGDGEPLLIHYEGKNTRGINVVMKRDVSESQFFTGIIPENQYYDFATPYGYGGWIIEGTETHALFEEYEDWIHREGVISEFVRFHPMVENHTWCRDEYEIVQLGEVVHVNLSSPEAIWDNFTSKNRNMVRKAIKNDIRIYNGRYPEIYNTFREIYNATMDKDEAERYYYFDEAFYKSLLEDLPNNAQVFYAMKDEKVIAASIILTANGRMNYHLSGSVSEYGSLAPSNLLLYKAALWGNANGCRTFYLGGGVGSGEDSLFRFKRAFNKGELNHFFIGKKIFNQEKYDYLVNMRGDTQSDFFPKYRARGNAICPEK